MKPHNLVNAEANNFGNHFPGDMESGTGDDSLFKKLLSAIIASALVFSIYAAAPNLMGLFNGSTAETSTTSQVSEQQVPNAYISSFVWTAKLKLEDLKLNHRLEITSTDQNQLLIKGNISNQETASWKHFLQWYETKEGFPVLIQEVGFGAVSGNVPVLISVWFDQSPTAYFADGSSGKVGTVLANGWKIVGIEAWATFVERDGTTITLSY